MTCFIKSVRHGTLGLGFKCDKGSDVRERQTRGSGLQLDRSTLRDQGVRPVVQLDRSTLRDQGVRPVVQVAWSILIDL